MPSQAYSLSGMGASDPHCGPLSSVNPDLRRSGHFLEFFGRISVTRLGFPMLLGSLAHLQLGTPRREAHRAEPGLDGVTFDLTNFTFKRLPLWTVASRLKDLTETVESLCSSKTLSLRVGDHENRSVLMLDCGAGFELQRPDLSLFFPRERC